ncbi:MAG: ATP-dependent RNA helicase RhlB [Candidatus Promineifilaceae bacterium]|jgi:ATP-dependent RNA helicase RhlB
MVRKFLSKVKHRMLGQRPAAAPVPKHPEEKAKPKLPDAGPQRRKDHHQAPNQRKPRPPSKPWSIDQFPVPEKEGVSRFHDFDLKPDLMHAIADLGFEYATPIQAAVLPHTLQGKDLTGQAQTGTGKTAAFLLSAYSRLLGEPKREDEKKIMPRVLVLAPTRELVVQIAKDAEDLSKHIRFKCLALYGGMDYERQKRQLLEDRYDIIAATPGRLIDFANQGLISFANTNILVLDEADRMLDMGFIPDVRRIIRKLPPKEKRQTLLFSATLSDDVLRLASSWTVDPVMINVEPETIAVDTVEQRVYMVTSDQKMKILVNLLLQENVKRVLVFANRRDRCQRLSDELERYGVKCGLLSGAVPQKKRMRILDDFKAGLLPVVVATDVAGRGIHVDGVSHVVNFELPYEPEDYVHRIGRTGRAGAEGVSVSFACEDESFIIPDIEAYIGRSIKCSLPEEELMKDLPKPLPRKRRPEGEDRSGGRSNGRRPGGSRNSSGGGRGPRRTSGARPAGGGASRSSSR